MMDFMQGDHRAIIVQKYGGSSVSDPVKIKWVAQQVKATVDKGYRVVVVVSAMGKTTDQLLDLAKSIGPNPPRRELDMLLSTGERISMALLAMALHQIGLKAISFTGSQSGIITNDRHSGARIIEVRPVRVEDELERDQVVIVAGFQGMSYKKEITTLGRGGSDTTAVAMAAALGAKACEIYSDVDGVYSADPRYIGNAHHLPEVTYDSMLELAEHGAKVLNAQAVKWAKQAGIVIHARKTGSDSRETRVLHQKAPQQQPLAMALAITFSPNIKRLQCQPADSAIKILTQYSVSLRHAHIRHSNLESILDISFVGDDIPDMASLLDDLKKHCSTVLEIENQGMVSVVSNGLSENSALMQTSIDTLKQHDISIDSFNLSPLCLNLWISSAKCQQATQLLHDKLCIK